MNTDADVVGAARERVERARALVEAGAYLVTAGAVLVYSDAPGNPGWTVEADGSCACPDATVGQARRLGLPCKHRIAVDLIAAARRAAAKWRLAEIEKEMSL